MPRQSSSLAFIGQWPRLTRFYGVPPSELQHWPSWLVADYLAAMPVLQAEEQLGALQSADHPHVEPADRRRLHRTLRRLAFGPEEPTVDLSTDKGKAAIGNMGFTVKIRKVES